MKKLSALNSKDLGLSIIVSSNFVRWVNFNFLRLYF